MRSALTAASRCRIRAHDRSRKGSTPPRASSSIRAAGGSTRGGGSRCAMPSSTSCIPARSAPRGRLTVRSITWITSSTWASMRSRSCPSRSFPAAAAGGTTESTSSRRTARYGGPAGLHRLIEACHGRGIAVILDVVYNHVGPEGDYLGAFGPYFTSRYETPWGAAFNYDGEHSDEVRRFVLDNVEMWVRDYEVDGLRLDAVHAIIDTSPLHILEAIAARVQELASELGRDVWVIAESDSNDPRLVRERDRGGYGLSAQWNDDFHHALHAVLTGERIRVLRGLRESRRGHHRDAPDVRLLGTVFAASQTQRRPAGERSAAVAICGVLAEPRSDRQPRSGRATLPPRQRQPGAHGCRIDTALTHDSDAVPGRGVGGEHAVSILHGARRCASRARR